MRRERAEYLSRIPFMTTNETYRGAARVLYDRLGVKFALVDVDPDQYWPFNSSKLSLVLAKEKRELWSSNIGMATSISGGIHYSLVSPRFNMCMDIIANGGFMSAGIPSFSSISELKMKLDILGVDSVK